MRGAMVVCFTSANIRITTCPLRWTMPKMGGFSLARVPRPLAPFSRWRRPGRSFWLRLPGGPYAQLPRTLHHILPLQPGASRVSWPRYPGEVGWSSGARHLYSGPTLGQSAHWTEPALSEVEGLSPMKYKQRIHTFKGWWWPAKMVPVKSSKRFRQSWHLYLWRWGWVSSRPCLVMLWEEHWGQATPSGQRISRTVA